MKLWFSFRESSRVSYSYKLTWILKVKLYPAAVEFFMSSTNSSILVTVSLSGINSLYYYIQDIVIERFVIYKMHESEVLKCFQDGMAV